jgi:hypothetical protein
MAYKNISELTKSEQTWTIKVKVIIMWESINPLTEELISIDMILMGQSNKNELSGLCVHINSYNR